MKDKIDKILLLAIIVLSIFGIIMIYSASSIWSEYKFNDSFHYLKYQSIFFIIGLIVMFVVSKIDYKIYYQKASSILLICIILLILVLIPGIGSVRNGSRSWFGIGSLGIQPSEFAKLGMIIFTSKYLTNSNKFLKSYKQGVFPILGILFFLFGLIMLQPDMGTGAILVVSIIALLFIAGVNMKFFIGMGVIGIIGVIIIIGICILPIIKIGTLSIIYSLASAIVEPIADGKIVKLLDEMSGVFKILLAILCTLSVLLIIGVTLVIKISNSGMMYR